MLTGAVVVELTENLLDESGPRDSSFLAQVVVEELMEMRMPHARQRRTHGTARAVAAACALPRSAGN
jgi:hypothetical protein